MNGITRIDDQRSHAWIGVIVTILVFLVGAKIPFFAPDSWSYLELSNHIFDDFYRINTVRQYVVDTPYGQSFPPLWPVLIASIRNFVDLGIYSGVVLNLVICLCLLAVLIRIARRLEQPPWVGTAIYLGMLTCTSFADDVLAARNCALSILFLALALLCSVSPQFARDSRHRIRSAALVGIWMGLACMNRFDAILLAAAFGLLIVLVQRNLVSAIIYFCALALVISPWIIYCKSHFGSWWISDNTRQVFAARDAFVMNYYQDAAPRDLFDHPTSWVQGLIADKIPKSWKGIIYCAIHSVTLELLAVVLVLKAGRRSNCDGTTRHLGLWCLLLAPFVVIPPTLVGYGDERCFLPLQLFTLIILLSSLVAMTKQSWQRARVLMLLGVLSIAVIPADGIPWLILHRSALSPSQWLTAHRRPTKEMQQLAEAVEHEAGGTWNRLLVYSPYRSKKPNDALEKSPQSQVFWNAFDPDGWAEWEYGALTGRQVAVMPRVKSGSFETFLRDWRITHIYDGLGAGPVVDLAKVRLVPLSVTGLYRVEFRSPEK